MIDVIRNVFERTANSFTAAFFCILLGCTPLYAAGRNVLPVPAITIYPGDAIRDGSLVDRDFSANFVVPRFGVITDRSILLGKIARRTLLPGIPIPTNAIMEPQVVRNGARVKVVFREAGLTITTYAASLQAGSVGDVVSVRNLESGLTISGVVQADGSIRVNGG